MDGRHVRAAGRPGTGSEVIMGDQPVTGAYRRRDEVLARRIAGEAMLVPIRGELARLQCIFALSPVGEYIWGLLDGRKSLSDIVNAIVAEFDVDPATAQADALEFLGRLRAEDLIEEAGAPA